MRLLEKDALAADAKHKFVVSMRLDLPKMLDQFDGLGSDLGYVAACR